MAGFGAFNIPDASLRRASGGSILFLLGVWTLLSSWFFWKRRHHHPIKERYWRLVLAGDAGIYLAAVLSVAPGLAYGNDQQVHCFVSLSILSSGAFAVMAIMCTRAFFLLMQFELGRALLASQSLRVSPAAQAAMLAKSWWVTHRHILSPQWAKRTTIRVVIAWLIFMALTGAWASTSTACDGDNPRSYANGMGVVLLLVIFAVVSFVLWLSIRLRRHGNDAYKIKSELVGVLLAIVVSVAFIIPVTSLTKDRTASALAFSWAVAFMVMALIGISTLYPLYLSYSFERAQQQQLASLQKAANLADLLAQPIGFEAFLKFTMSEFTTENVIFWSRVEDMKHGRLPRMQHSVDTSQTGSPHGLHSPTSIHMLGGGSPVGTPVANPNGGHHHHQNGMMVSNGAAGVEALVREIISIWNSFLLQNASLEVNVASKTRVDTAAKLRSMQGMIQSTVSNEVWLQFATFFDDLPQNHGIPASDRLSVVSPRRSGADGSQLGLPRSQTPPVLGTGHMAGISLVTNGTPPVSALTGHGHNHGGGGGTPNTGTPTGSGPINAFAPNPAPSATVTASTMANSNGHSNTASGMIGTDTVIDIGTSSTNGNNNTNAIGLVMSSTTPNATSPQPISTSPSAVVGGRFRAGSGISATSMGRSANGGGSGDYETGPSSHRYSVVDHAAIGTVASPVLAPTSPALLPVLTTDMTTLVATTTAIPTVSMPSPGTAQRRTPSPQPLRHTATNGPTHHSQGSNGSPRNASPRTVAVTMNNNSTLTPNGNGNGNNGSPIAAHHTIRSHVSVDKGGTVGTPTNGTSNVNGGTTRGSPGLTPSNALLSPTSAGLTPLSLMTPTNATTVASTSNGTNGAIPTTNGTGATNGTGLVASARNRASSIIGAAASPRAASPPAWPNLFDRVIHDLRHIYDVPQAEILSLMQVNSYVRFRQSAAYTLLLANAGQWIEHKSAAGSPGDAIRSFSGAGAPASAAPVGTAGGGAGAAAGGTAAGNGATGANMRSVIAVSGIMRDARVSQIGPASISRPSDKK